jgi:hypothetical protein
MKNLTYNQLIELAPKDRPFQIAVEMSSGITYGKSKLWGYIDGNYLYILYDKYTANWWRACYKGTFTLIDPRYQKPEVLKVGQKVRIMESARECGNYNKWSDVHKAMIGNVFTIDFLQDESTCIYYEFYTDVPYKGASHCFPYYCVMPVEEEETPERTLEDILSELSDTDKEIIKSKLK